MAYDEGGGQGGQGGPADPSGHGSPGGQGSPGDGRPRTARWRWREAAVTAAAFALCLLGGMLREDGSGLASPPVAAYAVAVVSCGVLPLRHRAPLPTMAVTTLAGLLAPVLDLLLSPLVVAPAAVAAYSLTAHARRYAAGAVVLTSAALLVASTPLFGALSWKDASRVALVAAVPLVAGVLGHTVWTRRAYLAAVEERALRAEQSRDSEARRRVAEERVRIARELHDLVAHQITLANAQATVAAHFFDSRPEQTRQSLKELVGTTSDALDELRATVGLLRQTGDAATPAEPAPGLSRLPALVESFRRAGLDVTVDQDGTARPLPAGLDLTAYRIVQEALTNVTKHAGTGAARVRLAWSRDLLAVTVADDGRDVRAGPGADRDAYTAGRERPPGYGLIGMRERAAAVGGDLSAGRRPDGGFLVSARLPLPPARDARPHDTSAPTGTGTGTGERFEENAHQSDGETGDTS
ncbi:sensor histidine kinase [Actinacidiphila alni]|uniref:sensor histidine kinase n=1 Tax=Actinacidiphila alni TaxID=380248 RepID=UPI0033F7E8EC